MIDYDSNIEKAIEQSYNSGYGAGYIDGEHSGIKKMYDKLMELFK